MTPVSPSFKRILAIDASRMAVDRSGIENYLHQLLPHLVRTWSEPSAGSRLVRVFASNVDVGRHVESALEVLPGGGRGWTQVRLAPALRRAHASVFFNPVPILPLVGGMPCPAVVTVHDLIEFRPRWWYFRRLLGRTLGQATRIVCVSQATREELVGEFPSVEPKCVVVHHGADPAVFFPGPPGDVLARMGLSDPPLLAVGTVQPRKNYARLIEAYSSLGGAIPPLVIVGKPGWDFEDVLALPGRLGVGDRVIFTGHLDEAEVGALMRASLALCAVSTGEGFGLPVLEAMSCGLPILAADIPPFREVGGTAATYVNPLQVADIAVGLRAMLGHPAARRQMSEAGIARGALFSWERAAAAIVEVLERA